MNTLIRHGRNAWDRLRAVLGDDAYERYARHLRRHHPEAVPLARAAFHRAEIERRWSGVNRCC